MPVQRHAVQVDTQQLPQDAQPVLRLGQFIELLIQRPGFGLRGAQVGADSGEHQELAWVAAERRRLLLDVRVKDLGTGQGLVRGEHGFGVFGRESLPVRRGPGLDEDRTALRGPRGVERTRHPEVLALMADFVDQGRVGEKSAAGVGHHGAVLPAVPQLANHADELVGRE